MWEGIINALKLVSHMSGRSGLLNGERMRLPNIPTDQDCIRNVSVFVGFFITDPSSSMSTLRLTFSTRYYVSLLQYYHQFKLHIILTQGGVALSLWQIIWCWLSQGGSGRGKQWVGKLCRVWQWASSLGSPAVGHQPAGHGDGHSDQG